MGSRRWVILSISTETGPGLHLGVFMIYVKALLTPNKNKSSYNYTHVLGKLSWFI